MKSARSGQGSTLEAPLRPHFDPLTVEDERAAADAARRRRAQTHVVKGGGGRKYRLSSPYYAYGFTAAALLVNIVGIVVPLQAMIRFDYTDNGGTLSAVNVIGVCLFVLTLVAGPILLGLAVVHTSLARGPLGNVATSVTAAVLGIAAFAGGWVALQNGVVPSETFLANPPYDTLRVALCALLFAVYPALGLAALLVAASTWCVWRSHPDAAEPRAAQPESFRDNARGAALLAAALVFAFSLAAVLSPVWNFSPSSYLSYISPQAINPSSWAVRLGPDPTDESHSSPVIIIKIYEDVTVWYVLLALLAAGGAAGLASKRVRRVLHTRVTRPFAAAPRWLLPGSAWRVGVTVGELALVAAALGYTAYFVRFWLVTFPRMYQEALSMGDPFPATQTAARLAGHITTLTMSLLALPITRNSVWEAVWGVPFERALRWHRLLGRLSWLALTTHMLLWQAKWLAEGGASLLWHNCTTLDGLLITAACTTPPTGGDCEQQGEHGDNWTIPVAEAAWLTLTAALVVAVGWRRSNYELFRVTHLLAWVYYAVAVLHAWSHWYYTAFGLVLLLVDKLTRFVVSAQEARVVSIRHAAGVTMLTVDAESSFGPRGHYAGQYAFLCIPALSPTQWHPFTVSSAPAPVVLADDDGASGGGSRRSSSGGIDWGVPPPPRPTVTFHIKNMGHGTWSGQLAEVALALASAPAGAAATSLALSVDGAYGRAGRYADRRHVVLVAGGIGITPVHAIAVDLAARLRDPHGPHGPPGRVRRVTLVWVSRDEALFTVLGDTLATLLREEDAAARAEPALAIDVRLHCTHPDANAAGPGGATTLARAASLRAKRSARTLVHDLAAAPRHRGSHAASAAQPLLASSEEDDDFDEPLLPVGGDGDAVDAANAADDAYARGLRVSPWEAGMCDAAAAEVVLAHVRAGRPDLRALLQSVADAAEDESAAEAGEGRAEPMSELVSVFVCGPDAMIEEASALAAGHGFDFHAEVFNF